MVVGANNSMSYLRPTNWWARIFPFIGRTQNVDYEQQYRYCGTRFFDLRLGVSKSNHIIFKNGKIKYETFSLYNVLSFFDNVGDVTVRITLDVSFEEMMSSDYPSMEAKFIETCKVIETIYPEVRYIGGYRKFDKKQLFTFKYERDFGTPLVIDEVNTSWVDRVFPFINAHKNNEKKEKYDKSHGFLLLNFVDRR